MSASKVSATIAFTEKQPEQVTFSGFYRCNHENGNLKIQELIASTDDWIQSPFFADDFDNLVVIKNKCYGAIFMHINRYFSWDDNLSNCVGPTDMSDWLPMYYACVFTSSMGFADYISSHSYLLH